MTEVHPAAQKIDDLVELCRAITKARPMRAGMRFVLIEGAVHARALEDVDLRDDTLEILNGIHFVRHWLGRSFELDSKRWNETTIAQMLRSIEARYRSEVTRIEEAVPDIPHNVTNILYLSQTVGELIDLLLSDAFMRKRWNWGRLRMLNAHARRFFIRDQTARTLLQISMLAELILTLDERQRMSPYENETRALLAEMAKGDNVEHLRHFVARFTD
jgi:hypothetical protein